MIKWLLFFLPQNRPLSTNCIPFAPGNLAIFTRRTFNVTYDVWPARLGLNEVTAGQPTCYIKHIKENLLVYRTSTLSLLTLTPTLRAGKVIAVGVYIYIYYIPPPLTVHFSMTRSVRYQPILHTLYYTLHTEHAYCLSYRFFNNVVITTVIEMVEMVEMVKYSMEDLVSVQLSE